jgi:IS30 family transposase
MKKYVQLNYEERVTIKIKLQEGYSIRAIARYLRRHPSTIKREIDRGITHNRTYFAESTERQIRKRKLRYLITVSRLLLWI